MHACRSTLEDPTDPSVAREIGAANRISLERGVNDADIVGGGGTYGFDTFLAHVDFIHGLGRSFAFDAGARSRPQREYGLAAFFLLDGGSDMLGNEPGGTPTRWWTGYDVTLGAPTSGRYRWQGLLRRDFQNGFVLVNGPEAPICRVALGGTFTDVRGHARRAVTVRPAGGAVLRYR